MVVCYQLGLNHDTETKASIVFTVSVNCLTLINPKYSVPGIVSNRKSGKLLFTTSVTEN